MPTIDHTRWASGRTVRALVAVLLLSLPAVAGCTRTARDHCMDSQTPDASVGPLTLDAHGLGRLGGNIAVGGGPNQRTLPLANKMRPRDAIRIRIEGCCVDYGGFPLIARAKLGPDGDGKTAPQDWPFPGGPQYGVFGTWNQLLPSGTGVRFPIGKDSGCVEVPSGDDGGAVPWMVTIEVNDIDKSDSVGKFQVYVDLWHPDPAPR